MGVGEDSQSPSPSIYNPPSYNNDNPLSNLIIPQLDGFDCASLTSDDADSNSDVYSENESTSEDVDPVSDPAVFEVSEEGKDA